MTDFRKYDGHTEGPWEADSTHCRTAINSKAMVNDEKKHIAMVNFTKNAHYEITEEEHEANVSLLTDAPLLLGKLREAERRIDELKEAIFHARNAFVVSCDDIETEVRIVSMLDAALYPEEDSNLSPKTEKTDKPSNQRIAETIIPDFLVLKKEED